MKQHGRPIVTNSVEQWNHINCLSPPHSVAKRSRAAQQASAEAAGQPEPGHRRVTAQCCSGLQPEISRARLQRVQPEAARARARSLMAHALRICRGRGVAGAPAVADHHTTNIPHLLVRLLELHHRTAEPKTTALPLLDAVQIMLGLTSCRCSGCPCQPIIF